MRDSYQFTSLAPPPFFFFNVFSLGNSFQCFSVVVGIKGKKSKSDGRELALVVNRDSDMSVQRNAVCSQTSEGGSSGLFPHKVFF